jgi:hypothetical protein
VIKARYATVLKAEFKGVYFMKKILKTVAMFLIVVMLANSLTSCVIITHGYDFGPVPELKIIAIAIDVTLVVGLVYTIYGIVKMIRDVGKAVQEANSKTSKQNKAFSVQIEQSSFMKTFNTIPKTQINLLAQKVQAVPETELISLTETFNAIPQTDITFKLTTVSDKELNYTVGYLNSLSEIQFNNLLKNINDNNVYETPQ